MEVVEAPVGYTTADGDRLAAAAAYRAFNWGLRQVEWRNFSHIGKLDGDIVLPEDYYRAAAGQDLRRMLDLGSLGALSTSNLTGNGGLSSHSC